MLAYRGVGGSRRTKRKRPRRGGLSPPTFGSADCPPPSEPVDPRPALGLSGAHRRHTAPGTGVPRTSRPELLGARGHGTGYRGRGQVRPSARGLNCATASPLRAGGPVAATGASRATWRSLVGPSHHAWRSAGPGARHTRTHALTVACCRLPPRREISDSNRAGTLSGREGEAAGWPRLEDPEKVGFLATSIGPASNVPRNVPVST